MCDVLLPPGVNPAAVKYIYIYHIKTNPSSIPQDYVDSYSTLPWVTWDAVTGVESTQLLKVTKAHAS
jgi:hypothetical protein